MSGSPIRLAVIVALAVPLQLVLWAAFRWLGLIAHGEVVGAPIVLWDAVIAPPLGTTISIAPCFAVGWLAPRYGAVLGALVGALASLASWAMPFVVGAQPTHPIGSALASAILGTAYGAAGAYFVQRRAA